MNKGIMEWFINEWIIGPLNEMRGFVFQKSCPFKETFFLFLLVVIVIYCL